MNAIFSCSICAEHLWLPKTHTPSKYSIFSTAKDEKENTEMEEKKEEEEEEEESAYSQLQDETQESHHFDTGDILKCDKHSDEETVDTEASTLSPSKITSTSAKKPAAATAKSSIPNLGRLFAISGKNGAQL